MSLINHKTFMRCKNPSLKLELEPYRQFVAVLSVVVEACEMPAQCSCISPSVLMHNFDGMENGVLLHG